MNEANSVFTFWIIGTYSEDLQWITQVFGLMRSAETIGAAVACALGGASNISPMTNLIVAFSVYLVAFPFAFGAVWQVPDVAVYDDTAGSSPWQNSEVDTAGLAKE